ncbi:M1 family metallopeptidase [Rapidithrix thailandica]|uniref:M1 family metallopeptidase n=1 Tax=Rapidithrix thailandica TaxID=413964 RepID=A0AAW9S5S2_9BACT
MKIYNTFKVLFLAWGIPLMAYAQANSRWQQRVEYQMEIDFDVQKHQFKGEQKLTYFNNSPDTLHKVFYHLYFNAFQPGSMMDVRSRTIADPDRRVQDRIYHLKSDEIGYHNVRKLTQNGKVLQFSTEGTTLEVTLAEPVLPGKKVVFEMSFESQVPVQIRRSGRMNKEGIDYTMTQWFPKMAEYDYQGWHADPYIGREFHGVWGDFDVKINIDSSYVLGGTGVLQNPQEVGHGYQMPFKKLKRPASQKLTWHFAAKNVHDFAWAADPDYQHVKYKVEGGPELHFLYQEDSLTKSWKKFPEYMGRFFQLMGERFGKYPYAQYSFIQGGDGGMEYPMCTMITGHRKLESLVGVGVHEGAHSWFQGMLATNEALYPWMDEGFTSFGEAYVMDKLFKRNLPNPYFKSYLGYFRMIELDIQEPMSTHADFYKKNATYGITSYNKGAVFLAQLEYVIGKEAFDKGMLRYFYEWRFKHPNINDFIRVMEKESGLELDWYKEQFVNSTNTIDYAIKSVMDNEGNKTLVSLERAGEMPMPLDIVVTLKNGKREYYYIPLRIMRGEKQETLFNMERVLKPDWPWTYPEYNLSLPYSLSEIESIVIDPTYRLADFNRTNNVYPLENNSVKFYDVSGEEVKP